MGEQKTYERRLGKEQLAILKGEGLGLPLASYEAEIVLAIMDGNVLYKDLADLTRRSLPTVRRHLHRIYAKSGATNMAHLVLMMTGAVECPDALLPAQRQWRRKRYKLDE